LTKLVSEILTKIIHLERVRWSKKIY